MTDKDDELRTNVAIATLILTAIIFCISLGRLYADQAERHAAKPSEPAPSAAPPAVIPEHVPVRWNDFDVEKKQRQIDWCERHRGVVAMTFTQNKSNVLCLRPQAVIPLPEEDGGRP